MAVDESSVEAALLEVLPQVIGVLPVLERVAGVGRSADAVAATRWLASLRAGLLPIQAEAVALWGSHAEAR